MTIAAATPSFIQTPGNGTATNFAFQFKIFAATDLVVGFITSSGYTQQPSGFSVLNVDINGGGNVVFSAPPPVGTTVDIRTNTPLTQTTEFANLGAFLPEAHTEAFDRLTRELQDLYRRTYTFGIHGPDTENTPWPALPAAVARAGMTQMYDVNGLPIVGTPIAGTITGTIIANLLNAVTAIAPIGDRLRSQAEITNSVFPTNYSYLPGDLRRYGATGGVWGSIPSTDDSAAWATAVSTGLVIIPYGMAFKVVTGAALTGPVVVVGYGRTSELYCDTTVLNVTTGTGSVMDNFWMGNISAVTQVVRNPASLRTTILYTSLVTSVNQTGYQPTGNDLEWATWISHIPSLATQFVGPVIQFSGAASGIMVSRIFGRFACINIMDAQWSTARDIDIGGGRLNGGGGCAVNFDNYTNNIQRGVGNRAINVRVRYASNSGVFFMGNDDFENINSQCSYCGESGIKTWQIQGVSFTASVGGATSGTSANTLTNGTYTCNFSDGETRNITVTGGTAVSWSGALNAGNITSAAIYQTIAQGGTSNINPQCFRGTIGPASCNYNYYDGADCASTYNVTNDSTVTAHKIFDIHAYGNGSDGVNVDGQKNSVSDIHCGNNGYFGLWNVASYSTFAGITADGNNTSGTGSIYDMLGGGQGNSIDGVTIYYTAAAGTNVGLYAAQSSGAVPHIIRNVTCFGAQNFYGNPGSVIPVVSGNIDSVTGYRTRQSGLFIILNNAGTLQHQFFNDAYGSGSAVLTKIKNNSSAPQNTPTGTDSSTAFAFGAKVSTTDTNAVVFDTAAQWTGDVDFEARVVINSTTAALTVAVGFVSFNVNGVTQARLVLSFWNPTTGAAVPINTTNIPAGKNIQVAFSGYLS